MSGPVPSPSMKGMMGSSGTSKAPVSDIRMASPEVGFSRVVIMFPNPGEPERKGGSTSFEVRRAKLYSRKAPAGSQAELRLNGTVEDPPELGNPLRDHARPHGGAKRR